MRKAFIYSLLARELRQEHLDDVLTLGLSRSDLKRGRDLKRSRSGSLNDGGSRGGSQQGWVGTGSHDWHGRGVDSRGGSLHHRINWLLNVELVGGVFDNRRLVGRDCTQLLGLFFGLGSRFQFLLGLDQSFNLGDLFGERISGLDLLLSFLGFQVIDLGQNLFALFAAGDTSVGVSQQLLELSVLLHGVVVALEGNVVTDAQGDDENESEILGHLLQVLLHLSW